MTLQTTLSPINGLPCVERKLADRTHLSTCLDRARNAQPDWAAVSLVEKAHILSLAVDHIAAQRETLAEEITLQMGRPISQAGGEIDGFVDRARAMLAIAPEALAHLEGPATQGFRRFIRREPVGTVLALAAWNYPYLIAVNVLIPALMSGNSLLLKHSDQTPLCSERIGDALAKAGLPDGVYQAIHMSHDLCAEAVADPRVDYVAFTGSVAGGQAVHKAAGGHFKGVGLELGGKDPAYVRADADVVSTAHSLVDGAYFNSGQSCCGIERIYVHETVYADFIEAFTTQVYQYRLGDPTDPNINLGPVVRERSANAIRAQIDEALAEGAVRLIDEKMFPLANTGNYLAPQANQCQPHNADYA